MSRKHPYFMNDQVHKRVSLIMQGNKRPAPPASALWPLIVVISTLTLVNLASATSSL
jgi:hypothetical protein